MNTIQKLNYLYTRYRVIKVLKRTKKSLEQDLEDNCFMGICYYVHGREDKYTSSTITKYTKIAFSILENNTYIMKNTIKVYNSKSTYSMYWFPTRPHNEANQIRINYIVLLLLMIDEVLKKELTFKTH